MAWVKFIFNRPNLADIMKAKGLNADGAVVYKYGNTIYAWPSDKNTGVLRKGDPLLHIHYPLVDLDQDEFFYEVTVNEIKFDFEDFMEAINLNKTNHYRPMWDDLTEVGRLLDDVKNLVIWTVPDRTILYSFIHHIIYSRLVNYISNIIWEISHCDMRGYTSRNIIPVIPVEVYTDHITIACELASGIANPLINSTTTYHNVIVYRDDGQALTRDSYKNLSRTYDCTGNNTHELSISDIDSGIGRTRHF